MVLQRLVQSSSASAKFVVAIAAWSTMLATARADDAPAAPASGFVSMFNGKDLTGWDGSPGWWQVHDGVLVGESTPDKPCQQTHYLYWQGGEPEDFDLRASDRLHGEANSGIQIRIKKIPVWDTWG